MKEKIILKIEEELNEIHSCCWGDAVEFVDMEYIIRIRNIEVTIRDLIKDMKNLYLSDVSKTVCDKCNDEHRFQNVYGEWVACKSCLPQQTVC